MGIKTNKKGFTLIELLVVIAIIAILAVFIIIRILTSSKDARNSLRKAHMNQMKTAIEQFRTYGGGISRKPWTPPSDIEDLDGTVSIFDPTPDNKYPKSWLSGGEWGSDPLDPTTDGYYRIHLIDENQDLYEILIDDDPRVDCPNGEACNEVQPVKN